MFKMAKRKSLRLSAKPDGGLNLSASPRDIAENELTEALNFTFDGNGLSLRPGLVRKIEVSFGKIIDVYPKDSKSVLIIKTVRNGSVYEEKTGIFIAAERAILFFDGENTVRIAETVTYNGGWVKTYPELNLKSGTFISTGGVTSESMSATGETITVSGENLLFVGSGCFYNILASAILCQSPSFEPHLTADVTLNEVVGTVPTVFRECTADGSGKKTGCRNLLTQKVCKTFTTDKESLIYQLDTDEEIIGEVSVTYRDTESSLVSLKYSSGSSVAVCGNIAAFLDRRAATLRFTSFLFDAKTLKNNLSVTYERKTSRYEEIASCSIGCFFGSRLFLSGSSDYPGKVYISSSDDLTDFPEELVVSVGARNEKVTAIARLFDSLVVFKETSIAAISVNDGRPTVAEICADFGCPTQNALVSFKNHLLWCTGDGVFTLRSTSQKDERAVVCLSEKISSVFKRFSQTELAAASAAVIGKCCLFIIGKTGLILNDENFDSTVKTAKFFMWSLPTSLTKLFVYNGAFAATDESGNICTFEDKSGRDFAESFDAVLKSKAFSFGDEDIKNVFGVHLKLSHDENADFMLSLWFDGEKRDYKIFAKKGKADVTLKPAYNRCKTLSVGINRDTACSENFTVGELSLSAADASPDGERG